MKNVISLCVFTLIVFTAYGQDYILRLNVGINKVVCNDVSIVNDSVAYADAKDGFKSYTSIDDIYGIHFYDEKPDELLLLSFQLDTIKCTIDSISDIDIYYRDLNRLLHVIDINDVFCILFTKGIQVPKIDSFYNHFITIEKQKYNSQHKIIRKNGIETRISKKILLTNDTARIQKLSKRRKTIDTYINTSSLNSIIVKEPADKQKYRYFDDYILSKEGKLKEVKINWVSKKIIDFRFANKKLKHSLEQNKKSIVGIFFYDYPITVVEKEEEVVIVAKKIEKKPKAISDVHKSKYIFDVGTGIGYMLRIHNTFNLPKEDDAYLNRLSLGFSLDANAKLFILRDFGVGVKYNYFHTNSSASSTLSERITVQFFGGTIFGNIPIVRNKGVFNIDLSMGLLTKNEHFDIYQDSYYLKGRTVGYYVSSGFDFFILENLTLGFNVGLLSGSLEKTDIDSDYNIEMDNPSYLNRLDGMIKVKFYLNNQKN